MLYIYTFLLYLLLPLLPIRIFWLSRKTPAYKNRWQERFAYFNQPSLSSSIWVHAVSLGESIAAIPLIKQLQTLHPNETIVVTTTTLTGANKIHQAFDANQVIHIYLPYDYPSMLKKFLLHIKPRILIIMETELWPNLLDQCAKQKVPVILANARLSANSFRGYKHIPSLTKPMLSTIKMVASQSDLDAQRFLALGLSPEKSIITGNIKFDLEIEPIIYQQAEKLRTSWGNNRPVWIAASTHEHEEEKVLFAAKQILAAQPRTLLVIVPRHPERFDSVYTLCCQLGFAVSRYSTNQKCTAQTNIILGDVIGQLLMFYAASDVAFVGGSFISLGGHNLLEPAAFAKPILSGPNLHSFAAISDLLLNANGMIKVNNELELAKHVIKLLNDKQLCNQYGDAAYNVVKQNRGATKKIITLINQLL